MASPIPGTGSGMTSSSISSILAVTSARAGWGIFPPSPTISTESRSATDHVTCWSCHTLAKAASVTL